MSQAPEQETAASPIAVGVISASIVRLGFHIFIFVDQRVTARSRDHDRVGGGPCAWSHVLPPLADFAGRLR
jgi:hypothetical protein